MAATCATSSPTPADEAPATAAPRLLIIYNPAAGGGRRRAARLGRVVTALEALGCPVVVRPTAGRGDAERLARSAGPEFDRIVAAGGDGTVNEVVNGIAGAPRPLALLPLGTANLLAREVRLPRDERQLAAIIAGGVPRPVWPARAGTRLFLCCLGVGFDADVVAATDARWKARLGQLAFVLAILAQLWRYRRREFMVRAANGEMHRAAAVIIANSRYFAGRFVLAPTARAAAPEFQVVLFCRGGRLGVARGLAAMALGVLDRLPEVAILPARSVALDAAAPVQAEADGDLDGWLPLIVETTAAPVLLVHPRL